MPEISQAWLALIGALLGGSGLKFIEHYLSRPKIKEDSATAFRNELREEVKSLREALRSAEADLDSWQTRYYKLLEDFSLAKIDRDSALKKIAEAAEEALLERHNPKEKDNIREVKNDVERVIRRNKEQGPSI